MVNHQASKSSLDKLILQVFEDQEDKFSFPLTTQKQARDFVRLLNHQGFTYEMLSEEIGEKFEVFRSWRLGSGSDAIGRRVMTRINKPIQEAMSCDVGTEEESTLCNDLVEDSKTGSRKVDIPEEGKNQLTKEINIGVTKAETEVHKDSWEGKSFGTDSESEKKKSKVDVEKALSEVTKSSDGHSLRSIGGKGGEKCDGKGLSTDTSGIIKASPSEQSNVEVSNNRKHLDTKEVLEKQTIALQTPSIVFKSEPDSNNSSAERKHNQISHHECEVVARNDKNMDPQINIETGEDNIDSKKGEHSEIECNRPEAIAEQKEHKPQIHLETLKKRDGHSKINENIVFQHSTEDDGVKVLASVNEINNERKLNVVSEKNDESQKEHLNQLPLIDIDKDANRSQAAAAAAATAAAAAAAPHQASLSPSSSLVSSAESSLNGVISGKISSKAELSEQTGAVNAEQPKHTEAENEIMQTDSGEQNSSTSILAEEKSKSELNSNTESHLRSSKTKDVDHQAADQSSKGTILRRSLSDSIAKESELLTSASGSIKSSPQTAPTSPSIPITVGTIPLNEIFDRAVDESYDSDLDLESKDHSAHDKTLIEKLRLLKTDEKQNSPGYLFVFSDTPAATGTGKHRIRIGVSRFPDKKFQQALLFNPDIRMVTSVAVEKRKTALQMAQDELKSMSLRGKRGWYWGSLDVIMTTIARLFEKQTTDQ